MAVITTTLLQPAVVALCELQVHEAFSPRGID